MLSLAAWLHDLDPVIVRITPGLAVRWYGLAYTLGFLYAWWVMRWLARRGATPLHEDRIADAMLTLVLCVVIGGRLGYALVYDPSLFTRFDNTPPWWALLAVHKGGMAYHGALVGVMVGGWLVARGRKKAEGAREGVVPWRHVMDLGAIACTVGLGLGRVANFVNGELLGKIVAPPGAPAPWWAVKFPQELLEDSPPALTPEQSERLAVLLDRVRPPGGNDVDAAERLVALIQSGPAETAARLSADLEPLLSARHPSQLYQAFFEGVILTALVWWLWRRPRVPGVVGASFLVGYGVLRVVAEFYRLPDAQFAIGRPGGLSRGQWLSVAMVVGGLAVLAWLRARREPSMGGWAEKRVAAT
ncbi:MAG TPA: prolipoprotein diacylglyceryl transferase [Phycisphaerales bacterium]|nr:prolipoprotein diacylglyceryl transferase [Phycisphaerales bacterium]